MADKLLALVGPGRGPRLCTRRMGALTVRLSGFRLSAEVVISHENGQVESTQTEVCELSIPPSEWVEVEYRGLERTFQATILSAR